MPKVTAAQATIVTNLFNGHAHKFTEGDKSMLMQIAMAFQQQTEIDATLYQAWVDRVTLLKNVTDYTGA